MYGFSIRSGGRVSRRTPDSPGVRLINAREVDRSDEGKAAKVMIRVLNNLDFRPFMFASIIARSSLPVQRMFVLTVMHYYAHLAELYDSRLWVDDEHEDWYRIAKDVDRFLNV